MSKEQIRDTKVEEAFVMLANGKANGAIDMPSLMKLGEKAVREALEAIRLFEKDQTDRAEKEKERAAKEKEREAALEKLLVAAGIISPVVDLTGVKGVRKGSVNYAYAELIARAGGATWDELEEVRVRESKARGEELGGITKFKGNFKSTMEKHGHKVTIDDSGMKLILNK